MNTTTPNLPSSLTNAYPDSRSRPMPSIPGLPASTEPPDVEARTSSIANDVHAAVDATADAGEDVVTRVRAGLHATVDGVADKVAPIVDRLKESSRNAGDLPGEWTDAARTVIRQRPIVAISGALLVGAALLHLITFSRR